MRNIDYHQPIGELSNATGDMHHAIESLTEELQAIDWYNQRIDICNDDDLKAILAHNRNEEKEHASMLLEWIRREDQGFGKELSDYLFSDAAVAHKRPIDFT